MNVQLNGDLRGRTVKARMAVMAEYADPPFPLGWLVSDDVAEKWYATISCECIMADKPLKGVVEIEGRRYVCTSSCSSGKDGIIELSMTELLTVDEYPHAVPIPYNDRFHDRALLRTWGRNYYGVGFVRIARDRSKTDYVLGWEWSAWVSKQLPAGHIEPLNPQRDLFTGPRPWPWDVAE